MPFYALDLLSRCSVIDFRQLSCLPGQHCWIFAGGGNGDSKTAFTLSEKPLRRRLIGADYARHPVYSGRYGIAVFLQHGLIRRCANGAP